MKIGNHNFDVENKTYIMGILNVTPDSFSDGGRFDKPEAALLHVREMIGEGADMIDVGGESTRPGHAVISDDEEIERVAPVVELIKKNFDIPVSIDTYKSKVARAALDAGADLVNDIWGLKKDPDMAPLIAERQAACCLMHNRETTVYDSFIDDLIEDLGDCVQLAVQAGIAGDRIILDPGIGFGKSYEMNLEAIGRIEVLHDLGYPLLLAASRKSVIGLTLDLPVNQRVEGTLVTTVMAVLKGCSFVRVHDIKENRRAITMAEAILGR